MLMRLAGGALILIGIVGQAAAQPATLGNRLGEYRQAPGGFSSRLGSVERSQDAAPASSQGQRPQPDAVPAGRVQPRAAGSR